MADTTERIEYTRAVIKDTQCLRTLARNSEAFYEKMGATQDQMVKSVIDGCTIPHFIYHL